MNAKLEQTRSVWMQTERILGQSALDMDTHADVCVVGAGIAGMTTAYLLLQEGKSVVVLDDGPIGGGQMSSVWLARSVRSSRWKTSRSSSSAPRTSTVIR